MGFIIVQNSMLAGIGRHNILLPPIPLESGAKTFLLPLSVYIYMYMGARPLLLESTLWKVLITELLVLSRNDSTQMYLLSTSISTNKYEYPSYLLRFRRFRSNQFFTDR